VNNDGGGSDSNGVLFQRGSNSAVVRSKSPKHGVSAIQEYKRKQAAAVPQHDGPVKTRIRTVPRLYGGSSASVESLVSVKSFDDLHGIVASPKRNKYPTGGRNSSRTKHIREAQQTLFRFLDSESSGGPPSYLLQPCGSPSAITTTTGSTTTSTTTGESSVRSLDLQQETAAVADTHQQHGRLKSSEYYSHLTVVAAAPRTTGTRSLNYDSEQSGRHGAPIPPKKPLRLSLQQRPARKNEYGAAAADDNIMADNNRHRLHHQHRHRRANDEVDLSAINNTVS